MNPDYGRVITSETYYDGIVTKTVTEMEVSVLSSRDELLKDIIEKLTPLTTGETHKLTMDICVNNKGKWQLIAKWSV